MKNRFHRRAMGALLLSMSAALTPAAGAASSDDGSGPILAKPEQIARERTALRIYQRPELQEQLRKAKALFAQSPLAHNPDARATIDRASEALALSAAFHAASTDTSRPFIFWGTNAAHAWHGIELPSSGYGLDSPDNIYRSATIDGTGRYIVRGRVRGKGPAQQTFVVYRGIPGVARSMNDEGHMDELAGIKSETIVRENDGSFVLTIDADPANGLPNHLQVPRDLNGMNVVIRDSLADWTDELPVDLTIERLDGSPGAPLGDDEMTRIAVDALAGIVPFWLNWFESYVYAKPLNDVPTPWKRVQGWGMTQQGRFSLKEGEAWVLTFDPLDALFFDFQISDPWTKAVEYVERTGSFNASQADANPDGTITLVASPVDPGVYNWLDTSGLHSGTFQVRWQGLPESTASGEGAVRSVAVVPLADLASHIPATMRKVDAEGRAAQRAERKASYARRLR